MAKNKMSDLQNHLFEALEMLKDKDIDVETAKGIAQIGQVIVNTRKQHLDEIKTIAGLGGDFESIAKAEAAKLLTGQNGNSNPIIEVAATTSAPALEPGIGSESDQTPPVKLTPLQQKIVQTVKDAGGESEVGILTSTRQETIQNLMILESRGVLVCVKQPPRPEKSGAPGSSDGYTDCGTWKLIQQEN